MQFHPDKSNVIHVTRARKKIVSDYFLHGQKLQAVAETKYLGVTIADNGEWDTHINNTVNSGNRLLGFLRRNLKVNSKSVKELAYKMLIRPKLEYAASVCGTPTKQIKLMP